MARAKRALLLLIVVSSIVVAAAFPVYSQESTETPEPQQEDQCQVVGELCADVDDRVERVGPTGPVNDPPGSYVRSLITIAAIAFVVLAYLFVALTGKRIPLPSLGSRS